MHKYLEKSNFTKMEGVGWIFYSHPNGSDVSLGLQAREGYVKKVTGHTKVVMEKVTTGFGLKSLRKLLEGI